MGTEKPSKIHLVDWTPPWLDNGHRLQEIIATLSQLDDRVMWQIVMKIMIEQLKYDLSLAREVNLYTEDQGNND